MKIDFNPGQQRQFLNVDKINQSFINKDKNNSMKKNEGTQGDRDRAVLSSGGKKNSMLESLMKQKQKITETKNELIGKTLENGKGIESIKTQLETYDEQLKVINEQMAALLTEEVEKNAEDEKKTNNNEPKTEEEVENEGLNKVTVAATDLKKAEVMSSVKNRIDSQARILEAEIELDKGSSSSKEVIEKKEAKLTELHKKSGEVASKLGEQIMENSDKVTENSETSSIKPSENEAAKENDENEALTVEQLKAEEEE